MKLLFLILLGASSLAQAQFQGRWVGQGNLTHSTGRIEKCSLLIDIEETPAVFFVKKSIFQCESMKIENKNPQPLDIKNGELWWGPRRLGIITDRLIQTAMQSPDGRKQAYKLELAQPHLMNYFDSVEWTLAYSTQLSGRLQRQAIRRR